MWVTNGVGVFLKCILSKLLEARELRKCSRDLKLLVFFSYCNKSRKAFLEKKKKKLVLMESLEAACFSSLLTFRIQ